MIFENIDLEECGYFEGCECMLCGQYLTPDGKCLACDAEIDVLLELDELKEEDNRMNIFIVHVNLGCCQNNSDGKMWVIAKDEETAKTIVKEHTHHPITLVENYSLNDEVLFSTFHTKGEYKLKGKTDNWGEWRSSISE